MKNSSELEADEEFEPIWDTPAAKVSSGSRPVPTRRRGSKRPTSQKGRKTAQPKRIERPFPRITLEEAYEAKITAFQNIDVFRRVVEHYKGSNLPEMQYLSNTLTREFGIVPELHDDFVGVFAKNCDYLNIKTWPLSGAEASDGGFTVRSARRQGSDVIQQTIVSDLLQADLVVADLTEHNPNVMFELGMRMAQDKPIALVRAKGTGGIFDVDNMLRVYDYDPNLWRSTIERDTPAIKDHISATWANRDTDITYMKLLGRA